MNLFWNRMHELKKISSLLGRSNFAFVTGRRRVGKTALLLKATEQSKGLYHQAIEGTQPQQIQHLCDEWKDRLPIFRDILPKNWTEFFKLLSREKLPPLLVLDEFPYLVSGASELPSLLQKWIDHELPKKKTSVFVSGSSQAMLHSELLEPSAPLYGRADLHLHLPPMSYVWFCKAKKINPSLKSSFVSYAFVGGVPYYWKLLPKATAVEQVQELFFDPSALLAEEPKNILLDENITGTLPKALLDLIGRGVSKPSELGARLGLPQGNLSRPLSLLLDLGLVHRDYPYGESSRSSKKVIYAIKDPALSFYYGTFLPHKSRWASYTKKEKRNLIEYHSAKQWEIFCREQFPGSGRYWEKSCEIDLVAPQKGGGILIGECKWGSLSPQQTKHLKEKLKLQFEKSALRKKLKGKVQYRIFTPGQLEDFC